MLFSLYQWILFVFCNFAAERTDRAARTENYFAAHRTFSAGFFIISRRFRDAVRITTSLPPISRPGRTVNIWPTHRISYGWASSSVRRNIIVSRRSALHSKRTPRNEDVIIARYSTAISRYRGIHNIMYAISSTIQYHFRDYVH